MSSTLNLLSDSTFGDKLDEQNAILEDIRDNMGGGGDAASAGSIATIETSPAATAHTVGEYIYYNTKLYKVIAAIALGDTLTVGTNIAETKVMDEIPTVTNSIASGNTDVPTSEAVYNAIQGSSPLGRLLLPTTRENFVSGADCFISTNYSNYNVVANVNTTVLPNSDIVFGINSFACKSDTTWHMWIRKELITTSAIVNEFDVMSKIYPVYLLGNYNYNALPIIIYRQTAIDLGSNIEYLTFDIRSSTTKPYFYSIYI